MKAFALILLFTLPVLVFSQSRPLDSLGLDLAIPVENQFREGNQKSLFGQKVLKHLIRKKEAIEVFYFVQDLDSGLHPIPSSVCGLEHDFSSGNQRS